MSQFGAEKFTTRSREAIEAAQLSATTAGNTTTEPIHLLVALLRQPEGTARTMITKAGVDAGTLTAQAESALAALPSASGATVQQPAASAALTRVLAAALDLASGMKDDYVATEHLLIALAGTESSAQKLLADAGLTEAGCARADRRTRQPPGHLPGRRVDVRGTGEVLRRPHPVRPRTASSTRSSAATPRSGGWCRCSAGVPRTTRC